jgi:hypothetical protein
VTPRSILLVDDDRDFLEMNRGEPDLVAMHADAYFDKPVEPGALSAKVAELLG